MSRNAIAAMAVIFVSGFAGCAATARAADTAATEAPRVEPAQEAPAARTIRHGVTATPIKPDIYVRAGARRAKRGAPPA